MQPRSLKQVLSELDSVYAPQLNAVKERQAMIPGQIQAEEQGLQAKQTQAYDDILGGARRRGLGFAGIPLGEQARYSATEYMPALARLRQSGREQAMSLEEALMGINERRRTQGQSIYEGERTFAESRRQFNESLKFQQAQELARQREARAAATSAPNPNFGGGQNPNVIQRKDKGFDFKDQNGMPISAAAFAAATGTPFRQLLQTMANQGDAGAKQALGFVGDDYGYDPTKTVRNQGLTDVYNSLVWGVKPTAKPTPKYNVGIRF